MNKFFLLIVTMTMHSLSFTAQQPTQEQLAAALLLQLQAGQVAQQTFTLFNKTNPIQLIPQRPHLASVPFLNDHLMQAPQLQPEPQPATLKKQKQAKTRKKRVTCKYCGSTFSNLGNLNAHIRSVTKEEKDQGIKCIGMQKEQRIKNRAKKKHQCPNCPMSFDTEATLEIHSVVQSEERKFKCCECSKSFKDSKTLRTHTKTHSNVKRHQCSVCPKTFGRRTDCRKHLSNVHKLTEEHIESIVKRKRKKNAPLACSTNE